MASIGLGFASRAPAQIPTFPAPVSPDQWAIGPGTNGSAYVPIDNWVYPALVRLHALGYVDTAYLGLRPWTRLSIAHMLDECQDAVENGRHNAEARAIYDALRREFQPDLDQAGSPGATLESVYSDFRGISGTPLRDSFHLGQSLVDDYGRPYETGFNDYSGFSGHAEDGRFSLYFRGEFQHGPSAAGYSSTLAAFLSTTIDGIPYATNPLQDTIPEGPIPAADNARILEANLSYHVLSHEISIGTQGLVWRKRIGNRANRRFCAAPLLLCFVRLIQFAIELPAGLVHLPRRHGYIEAQQNLQCVGEKLLRLYPGFACHCNPCLHVPGARLQIRIFRRQRTLQEVVSFAMSLRQLAGAEPRNG